MNECEITSPLTARLLQFPLSQYRNRPKLTCSGCYRTTIITPILKLLHWLIIPEPIHFRVLSLSYNSLPYSQPTYLRKLFTIQQARSTWSTSYLSLPRHSCSGHFSSYVLQQSHIHHYTASLE